MLRNNTELVGKFSGCITLKGDLQAFEQEFQLHDETKMPTLQEEVNEYEYNSSRRGCNCVVN